MVSKNVSFSAAEIREHKGNGGNYPSITSPKCLYICAGFCRTKSHPLRLLHAENLVSVTLQVCVCCDLQDNSIVIFDSRPL